jgi:tRNA(Met) cytidine acetyltransferase
VTDPAHPPIDARRLVLLDASAQDAVVSLVEAIERLAPGDVLWVGERAPGVLAAVPARRVRQHLGSESRLLVFDGRDGFDPDAFAAAVGTLRGGGDCILILPPPAHWRDFADPYLQRIASYPGRVETWRGLFLGRLAALWVGHPGVTQWRHAGDVSPRMASSGPVGDLVATAGQRDVVDAVLRVARGHARRPLVLVADRGRGKSTALGLAAARLLHDGFPRITVVAHHRRAVERLFRAAAGDAPDLARVEDRLRFRLPGDVLADDAESPGLVLVDEAAALSVGVLHGLLQCANRLVFASTEHGYEGSGRGFALRFDALLRETMPHYRRLRLDDPVRWAADDPLEHLVNRGLLLDAGFDSEPDRGDVRVSLVGADDLVSDARCLEAVFGLLVTAHYQTRPSDLRRLLDDPGLRLWVAWRGTTPAGVLLAAVEGGFDPTMANRILGGERRPHGHLLPQSLAVHAGLDAILGLRTLRIVRIAVHPATRRQGHGGRLLAAARDWAAASSCDLIGCSFGVDADLLSFWSAQGMRPARLGLQLDPASAALPLFLLDAVGPAGVSLVERATRSFHRDLPLSLGETGGRLPARLAIRLLHGRDTADVTPEPDEFTALCRIADGARVPASATAILWRWLVRETARSGDPALAPLVAWRLQGQSTEAVCRQFGLAGRRALEGCLRSFIRASLQGQRPRG